MKKKLALLINVALLFITLIVLGACSGGDGGGDWSVSVDSAETMSSLEKKLSIGSGVTTEFYLDDSSSTFLVVSFSLQPTGEDRSLDLQEITVSYDESGPYSPIGLHSGRDMTSWEIRTSGACEIEIPSENEVLLDCDVQYEDGNVFGIVNDELKNHSASWSGTSTIYQGPMLTLAYVIPSAALSSDRIWLNLPASEPVTLKVAVGD
jgi:hypothetical protein